MSWPPHLTVATVIEKDNRFLCVEEHDQNIVVVNQPAGHLEPNETLIEAAIRETLEETAYLVQINGFVGFYQYYSAANDTTYFRFCFVASVIEQTSAEIDKDIIRPLWLSRQEIEQRKQRSPLVLQCIDDATQQPIQPLSLLKQF